MTTTALPFSPLTSVELDARCNAASWAAVCSLTFTDRYPKAAGEGCAEDALREARKANEFHAAHMLRIEGRS